MFCKALRTVDMSGYPCDNTHFVIRLTVNATKREDNINAYNKL